MEGNPVRIFIAIDELSCAKQVVTFAAAHNWGEGVRFNLIHVISPVVADHSMISYPLFLESISTDAQIQGNKLLSDTAEILKNELHASVETEIAIGTPSRIIVEHATDWKADMIILGSHGRRGLSHFFAGSVSEEVVLHAPCSVVVLRLPHPPESAHDKAAVGQKSSSPSAH